MNTQTALLVLAMIAGGAALFALGKGLERATRRPGLSFLLGAILLLAAAGYGLAQGQRLLPFLFGVQAAAFLSHARWLRRTATRDPE